MAAGAAGALANSATAKLQGLLGAPGTPAEPPGKAIEQRYDALIKFVGNGPGAPLDSVLKTLSDLQQALDRLNNPTPGAPVVPGGAASAIEQLRIQASQSPEPVRRWLIAMVGGASSPSGDSPGGSVPGKSGAASPPPPAGGGAIQKQLALAQKQATLQAFNAPDGPAMLCQRAVSGRYPFVPSSSNDIPLDDFARLFAPGGLLDSFFNSQLRPFVNTAGTNWKLQTAGDVEPPISPGDLAQFQRAAAIRDLFFGPGGKDPAVRFDITPISADNVTKQVTIDLGDQQIVYAHGPTRPVTVNWPGTNRIISARLAFDPPPTSGSPVIQTSGPWALFRLFDHGTLRQTGSADRYNLDFVLGNRTASFEIRAGSVLNPLAPGLLRAFSCPAL